MKKEEFKEAVAGLVWEYINNEDMLGKNAQIRVNPELLYVDLFSEKEFLQGLADSEETIEDATFARGDETESATDYQAAQNPDFYPASTLVEKKADGKLAPNARAIDKLADNYFGNE